MDPIYILGIIILVALIVCILWIFEIGWFKKDGTYDSSPICPKCGSMYPIIEREKNYIKWYETGDHCPNCDGHSADDG